MNGKIFNKKIWMNIVAGCVAIAPMATTLHGGMWDSVKNVFIPQEKPKPPTIKVLVVHDVDGVLLEVKGKYNIIDPYKNERLGTRFVGKSNLIQALTGGLKWGEEFPGVYQIEILPDNNTVTTVIDGIEYKGNVFIYDIGGSISIVNEVDIEDFLSSTLALQFDKALSKEAMAAAAIAARTDAYHKATTASNLYWHVEANKVGYLGNGVAHRPNGVDDALAATRYMVMSKTSKYEGDVTPFPVNVATADRVTGFSPEEADKSAQKGENAAKILAKKFPNTSIELIHNVPGKKEIAEETTPEARNNSKAAQ
jgi:hypothetical protein